MRDETGLFMVRLKEADTIYVGDAASGPDARFGGIIHKDTRYFETLRWELPEAELLSRDTIGPRLVEHYAVIGENRRQLLAIRHEIEVGECAISESWEIANLTTEPREWRQRLIAVPSFQDIFAQFAAPGTLPPKDITTHRTAEGWRFEATAMDARPLAAAIAFPAADDAWTAVISLSPGEAQVIGLGIVLEPDAPAAEAQPLPSYAAWRRQFRAAVPPEWAPAHARAVDDLRMLLLPTAHGPYPAAGMPWFGNKFGRDALITALMVLPEVPEMLRAVIAFLAEHQGQVTDPFREEEPGKILHEIRQGELSRTNRIPFGRYYGSVDATALFVVALGEYVAHSGDAAFARQMKPALDAALGWLLAQVDGPSGLLRFEASGSGLVVQSWKDSHDSMNHADGTPAPQPLAVAEVQGYAFAAFHAAAALFEVLGEDAAHTAELRSRAGQLQAAFHARYWLPGLGTYAMALDRDMQPLAVLSSDPGHLLWSGIVPSDVAAQLVATMMSEALWSGWGLRTLGTGEKRYAPSSYHNGSVWPHDTAIFAMGLARYGFDAEYRKVRAALFETAMNLPDHRIPELISGHPREPGLGPVQYGHASSPQAWAAASLIMLARSLGR
jgi:glycogen debranching enzyme